MAHSTQAKLALLAALAVVATPLVARAQNDDDDEGPAAKPAEAAPAKPEAKPEGKPAETKPAETKAAPAKEKEEEAGEEAKKPPERPKPAPLTVDQGYLEGRAEVESPNEAIHTVQKKTYNAANRFEATLYPAAIQLNSKFVNTDGVALAVDYALQENFALQIMGLYNYIGSWASLTGQLLDIHARPQAADQIILQGGLIGGFEVAPLYGKFSYYDNKLAQFRFVLNAGAGIGFTEVQLSGSTDRFPTNSTSYGSTGPRFLGNLGMGFRVLLLNRIAIRLEVRDLLYTAKVDAIDGCSLTDIQAIQTPGSGTPSSGCSQGNFSNPSTNQQHATAAQVAQNLLSDNSADVVNDIVFFGGVSWLF